MHPAHLRLRSESSRYNHLSSHHDHIISTTQHPQLPLPQLSVRNPQAPNGSFYLSRSVHHSHCDQASPARSLQLANPRQCALRNQTDLKRGFACKRHDLLLFPVTSLNASRFEPYFCFHQILGSFQFIDIDGSVCSCEQPSNFQAEEHVRL